MGAEVGNFVSFVFKECGGGVFEGDTAVIGGDDESWRGSGAHGYGGIFWRGKVGLADKLQEWWECFLQGVAGVEIGV